MRHALPEDLPDAPVHQYRPETVREVLAAAESYLLHADDLIYSGGGRTFLSGYDVFDAQHGNRGNIDCSTFLLLVLTGIPYENSPYATGITRGLSSLAAPWADPALADFSRLPERYRGIAEVIGRPDLVGDDGVDLEKAKASGIDWNAVHEQMARDGKIRRAHQVARYCWGRGECFSDAACLRPGDLVFYRATPKWLEGYRFFGIFREIAHVGIVSEDEEHIYNSSGYIRKERTLEDGRPAVSLDPVFGKREPAFFARPSYGASFSGTDR